MGVNKKRGFSAVSGPLQCSIVRDTRIKLYGGRVEVKVNETDIIDVDGVDCVKIASNKRDWIIAVAAVAGVELELDDDNRSWKHGYTLAHTRGWKSLQDARFEASRDCAQSDDEESTKPAVRSLFSESEQSPSSSSKISRAIAQKWRVELELIDIHVDNNVIKIVRHARRSAIPVIALTPLNIENFISHIAKDCTLDSMTPRAYGQNEEKGVYTKKVTDSRGVVYNYKFSIDDDGKHVSQDGADSDAVVIDAGDEDEPQSCVDEDVVDAGDVEGEE